MREVKAKIHSLDGDMDTVTIVEEKEVNHVIVCYKGRYCTAIYNVFVGAYYVDDIYGIVEDYKKDGE